MSREETLREISTLLEQGNIVLYAIKHKLDCAKMAYDEGKALYEAGEYIECIAKLTETQVLMEAIVPMIESTEPVEMEIPHDAFDRTG